MFNFFFQDDIDLMIHYPDSDNAIQQTLDNTRAIHLPLWSDVGVSSGGVDALGGAGGAAGAASHVTPNHPLLMGRQPGSDACKYCVLLEVLINM